MRCFFSHGAALLAAVLAASVGPALATGAETFRIEAAAEVAAPPAPVPADPLFAAVLSRLEAERERTRPGPERAWLGQLATLYANRDGRPFWIRARALNEEARAAIGEIRRAGEWGLDPKAFALPAPETLEASPAGLAAAELAISRAVARYVAHAYGGRVNPSELSKWLDQRPRQVDAAEAVAEVAGASDPAATLRGKHPDHPQFEALRQAYLKATGQAGTEGRAAPFPEPPRPAAVVIPEGPRLRPGDRHPDIALIRRRLAVPAGAEGETAYDERLAEAVIAFRREAGMRAFPVVNEWLREALNRRREGTSAPGREAAARTQAGRLSPADLKRLVVNMERWRWLPADLGQLHIWNNLPEFETRVVKSGKVVHQERIIIGKAENQTPVFSDRMRYVVFRPEWGVPATIKVQDLLPALQDGDYDILDRREMRIVINGRDRDPGDFKWDRVDIRTVPIVQGPGSSNPLGQMKFMFPNRHDVYMHDTPKKSLFNSASRMFSFGCIRVRNPKRLAELVFGEDQGWAADDVAGQISSSASENNKVDLKRAIPVHNVYFTMIAEPGGALRVLSDIYGHDKRIREALDGRPIAEIAEEDPALRLERALEEIAPRQQVSSSSGRPSARSSAPVRANGSRGPGPGYLN